MASIDMKAEEKRALEYLRSLNIDMAKLGYPPRELRAAEFSASPDNYIHAVDLALSRFARDYGSGE